jgi:hypothetical protein
MTRLPLSRNRNEAAPMNLHHDTQPGHSTGSLEHLHPDRIHIGGIGVFSGDWAWTTNTDGASRIPVGFVGTLIDRWNGWAVFSCTRQVAEAIVADQQRQRELLRREMIDQGMDDDGLDTTVDESLANLYWDGDTIVADQRAMYDDPQALERITPDSDGRYVVMGRNWCWEAVHPKHCDRIVGDLPTPQSQQEFVLLDHTPGMLLPDDRLCVHIDRQWLTTSGLAYTGVLTRDGVAVGAIRDLADGRGAQFEPRGEQPDWPGMAGYAASCRHRGAAPTAQRLLDALIDEYHVGLAITEAQAADMSAVRLMDNDGRTRILGVAPTPTDRWTEEDLRRQIADVFNGSGWAGDWLLWRGRDWWQIAHTT